MRFEMCVLDQLWPLFCSVHLQISIILNAMVRIMFNWLFPCTKEPGARFCCWVLLSGGFAVLLTKWLFSFCLLFCPVPMWLLGFLSFAPYGTSVLAKQVPVFSATAISKQAFVIVVKTPELLSTLLLPLMQLCTTADSCWTMSTHFARVDKASETVIYA